MTQRAEAAVTSDERLITADDDRLVWKLQHSTFRGVSLSGTLVTLFSCALIGAALWWMGDGRIGVLGVVLITILLAIVSAVTFLREGTLIALRASNELFIEWRTLIQWRQRQSIAKLSEITSYDVRSFIDADSAITPHEVVVAGNRKPICYTADEATAKAVGEHILSLRPKG